MPPKATRVGAAASGVGDPAFQFVLSVLKHCESIKPDWNEVAKEHGIAYGKNATARFKSLVENHGLKYADGKLTNTSGAAVGVATAVASPNGVDNNATPKTPKSRGRKRKADDGDVVDGETPSKKASARKGKKSQPIVKEEDEVSDEKAEVKEEVKEEGEDTQKDTAATGAEEVKSEAEE